MREANERPLDPVERALVRAIASAIVRVLTKGSGAGATQPTLNERAEAGSRGGPDEEVASEELLTNQP